MAKVEKAMVYDIQKGLITPFHIPNGPINKGPQRSSKIPHRVNHVCFDKSTCGGASKKTVLKKGAK